MADRGKFMVDLNVGVSSEDPSRKEYCDKNRQAVTRRQRLHCERYPCQVSLWSMAPGACSP